MTPEDIKRIRNKLGMTQQELADALRMSRLNGGRTVRKWESGDMQINGPASLALEYMNRNVLEHKADIDRPKIVIEHFKD
jgi:DNA-binding transcriptional regulator YiaG